MMQREDVHTAEREERLATALKAAALREGPSAGFVDRVMTVVRTLPVLSPGLSRLARWIQPLALIGAGLALLVAIQAVPTVLEVPTSMSVTVPDSVDFTYAAVNSPATVVASAVISIAVLVVVFMEISRK
jgi:hypothetical protein